MHYMKYEKNPLERKNIISDWNMDLCKEPDRLGNDNYVVVCKMLFYDLNAF